MRFHRDWLHRVLRVPYVPTLGPVHPEALSPDLFDDVITASRTGQLLPFDKDRRWSDRKDDSVLVGEIIHQPDHTIIPVLSRRAGGVVKTYYYGTNAPDRDALGVATRRWCAIYSASTGRMIWFDPVTPAAEATTSTRVLLKVFDGDPPSSQPTSCRVVDLDGCPPAVRATFTSLAQQLHTTGFGFLHRRWRSGQIDGPILVAVAGQDIVGAIGPLRTMPDRRGHPRSAPPVLRGAARTPRPRSRPGAVACRDGLGAAAPRGLPAAANRNRAGLRPTVCVRRPHLPGFRLLGDGMTSTTAVVSRAMRNTRPRIPWGELPETVRRAIESAAGAIRAVEPVSAGLNCGIAATGRVFIKGLPSDHPRVATQRREAEINSHVAPIAPRLLCQVDFGGWNILAFEHLDGRRANLTPDSADLPKIADTLTRLGQIQAPQLPLRRAGRPLGRPG